MKNRIICIITMLALSLGIFSGCSEQKAEVPQLIESVAGNESYRPVEYMDLGIIDAQYGEKSNSMIAAGCVVPVESAYFFTTRVKLKEICVRVGDEVKKGDVLASVDTESIMDNIVELQDRYNYEVDSFEQKQKIYESNHEAARIKMLSSREFEEDEEADKYESELKVMEENNRFDIKLHELKLSQILDKISDEEKLIKEHDIVSGVDGTVTFVKDMKGTNYVEVGENVVVVADKTKTYIELSSCNLTSQNKRYLKKYDRFYTYVDGIKHEIDMYEYTPQELALADNKRVYPCARFKFAEEELTPQIGENVLIYMTADVKEHVPVIGNDSVFSDEQGDFVYVLEDGVKKTRYVKLGYKDEHYREVLSGLEVGEQVFYTTNTYILNDYETFEVEPTDFVVNKEIKNYNLYRAQTRVFYSEYEGTVESVEVDDSAVVSKGDLIARIKLNEGGAVYASQAYDVKNITENYDRRIRELEKAKKELNESKTDLDTLMYNLGFEERDAHDFTEGDLRMVYSSLQMGLQMDVLDGQMKLAAIDHDYQLKVASRLFEKTAKNNDGHGVVSIYAECDGEISNMKLKAEKKIEAGDRMFDIDEPAEPQLAVNTNTVTHMGQTVKMIGKDSGTVFTGKVIGGPGVQHNVYLTQIKDKMYVSSNTEDSNKMQYYVGFENDEFYKNLESCTASFDDMVLRDMVVIPKKALYSETVVNTTSYYVWRIVEGTPIKQYVTTLNEANALNTVVCISRGLKAGDVIAMERGTN